jgi:hypothetical protein
MSLQILEILDQGTPNLERVLFQANAQLTLSYYVALHSTTSGDGVASGGHPAFWFPTITVPAGAMILLFTGSNLSPQTVPKPLSYFWGLKQTIFNAPTDTVVIVQAATWHSVKAVGRAVKPPVPPSPVTLGNLFGGFKG